MARSTHQHVTIVALQQTSNIMGTGNTIQVLRRDIMEILSVVGLQRTIHADIEQAALVLHDTVHIVAGHTHITTRLLLQDTELVAVIAVQAVTRRHPNKPIVVNVDLCCETARHLFVSIKQFSHLSLHAQSRQDKQQQHLQA